ncbi:MAG: hypothetical protein GY854_15600 [Deltaproteobacteria bacterium]|nr:hypothetical protein [Deltaproteobacteria bacterium]
MTRNKRRVSRAVLCVVIVLAGCGGDSESADGGLSTSRDAAVKNELVERDADVNEEEDAGGEEDAGIEDAGSEMSDIQDLDDPAGLKELAEVLKERRRRLALREREIIRREQLLADLEIAVMERSGHLKTIKAEIVVMLEDLRERVGEEHSKYEAERLKRVKMRSDAEIKLLDERAKHITHLVATIKGMRSSSGASLLGSMDHSDAVAVLRKLGPRQAAGLLGGMTPVQGAKLAQAMLGPKTLPRDFVKELPKLQGLEREEDKDGDAGVPDSR